RLQRGKDLLEGEIAGNDEDDECVGGSGQLRHRGILAGALLLVAAELVAESREYLVGEVALTPGAEALVECGAQHRRGNRFVDRGGDGPAPLARVGDSSGKARKIRTLVQCPGGEIEQPGADHA